jgi:hypothetical protein
MIRKPLLLFVCLVVFSLSKVQAQQALEIIDPDDLPLPKLILNTGLSYQWVDPAFRTFCLSAEKPFRSRYNHLGIQANIYYKGEFPYCCGPLLPRITRPSLEIGMFYKLFMHGRLSGRKSSFYYGPDLRYGQRNYEGQLTFNKIYEPFSSDVTKFLFRLGLQHTMGNAVIEINFPIGIEREKLNTTLPAEITENFDTVRVIMLPTFGIGYSFDKLKKEKSKKGKKNKKKPKKNKSKKRK